MIPDPQSPRSIDWASRLGAALFHLGGSATLALIVAATVFGLWFPGPYRSHSGGAELFILVCGVDLALGPLITLVIFDRRKPISELRRDVAIIIALQLAALVYGLNMVSISRPVVLALEQDRFRVVAATGVYMKELPSAPTDLRSLSLTGPRLVRSVVPTDPGKKLESVSLGLAGFDIGTRPSLWTHWDAAARAEALAHAKPLAMLALRHPGRQKDLDSAAASTGRSQQALVYIPMITFRDDWVALLDVASGDVLGFAPFDGF